MFCSKCGNQSAADAWFCAKCGAALRSPPAPATSIASATPEQATQVPASTALGGGGASSGFDDEVWRAAIGPKNTDYYLSRFRDHFSSGRRSLWHWPAFFVTFYWLLYRKLWVGSIAYFVLPYILALLLGVALGASGAEDSILGGMLWLIFLAIIFVGPPLIANTLYYSKIKSLVEQQSRVTQNRDRLIASLEAKGGTSQVAAIVVGVFAVIAVIGILAAVSLPAYNDYTKRAKSSEAIAAGMAVAKLVGEHFERTGEIPDSLEPFQSLTQPSKYLEDMQINQTNGVIELKVTFGQNANGGSIFLIPTPTDNREVSWSCKAEPAMHRFVPQSCRSQ